MKALKITPSGRNLVIHDLPAQPKAKKAAWHRWRRRLWDHYPGLRTELLQEFGKITRNYRENRWEAAELNGGRFCEIVYTILDGYLDGHRYAAAASKPKDMMSCHMRHCSWRIAHQAVW
jgi:hypothetical protein